MAIPIVRKDDEAVHGCWGGHKPAIASENVFIDGIPALRKGDAYFPHCCPGNDCHSGNANGTSTVFINGKPAQKIGDPVTCGSIMIQGSPSVFIM